MAVALDADSSGIADSPDTSKTLSHTCTGTDRGLLVWMLSHEVSNNLTGVTYSGTGMVNEGTVTSADNEMYGHLFSLVNPATGANDIVFSWTSSGHTEAVFLGRSMTDVHQTEASAWGGIVTSSDTEVANTNPKVTVTGAANGLVMDGVGARRTAITLTIGANQTDELTLNDGVTRGSSSIELGSGSKSMDWTTNVAAAWVHLGILVNPTAVAVETVDMWHPMMEQPYSNKIGVVSY